MSEIQRRKSQRLASALQALTSDLDIQALETEVDENVTASDMSPKDYMGQDPRGYGDNSQDAAKQYLGQDQDQADFKDAIAELEDVSDCEDEQCKDSEEDEDFESAFAAAMAQDEETEEAEQDEEIEQGSIEQGDPGVDEFGSQMTYDTDSVRGLGPDYGVDFDGDDQLQDTIRAVPGRSQKQAKIKKLVARIQNVANHLERTGRKNLAYRLDIVCNNLESKYLK